MKKILIIGSGGREHALAWKISKSNMVEKIFVLPGNPGMSNTQKVQTLEGKTDDFNDIYNKAKQLDIDLVIIGPEGPLSNGIVDYLTQRNILTFGPNKDAARLESSKIFSKLFMTEFGINTAKFNYFGDEGQAYNYLDNLDYKTGVVIKSDELAAGKGVVVTNSKMKAKNTVHDFLNNPHCSVKSDFILIEEKLTGKEVSAFALCDGENIVTLGFACDYKRVYDGDQGPNTGGMGGHAPLSWPTEKQKKEIEETVFKRTIDGMKKRGIPFKGVLFAGLMIDGEDISVLEYNVRFGDPETQILLPLIDEDITPYLFAVAKGDLKKDNLTNIKLKKESSIHVVMSSKGYPSTSGSNMLLNSEITIKSSLTENELIFYSGVRKNSAGSLVNSGGRVLGITVMEQDLNKAREKIYKNISNVSFDSAHWRKDIGL